MHIAAVLNIEGGTLKTRDVDEFAAQLRATLEQHEHTVTVKKIGGAELMDSLNALVSDRSVEAVMIAGGDGTVSAAAGVLSDTGKPLAILPAGTMNLFARSLGIPLDIDEAVEALAKGEIRPVDVARANGRIFVHQFSVGLHPTLIKMRENQSFKSRLGKMRASTVAAFQAILKPPRITLQLHIDGERRTVRSQSLGITNNLFGEGHLPFADEPDKGELGVYITKARKRSDLLKFVLNLAIGRWRASPHLDILTAKQVRVEVTHDRPDFGCAIDGELCDLEEETLVEIRPGSLQVITPAQAE